MKIGFTGLLTLAFIVLKLTGHIAWSWWWVLSPIWITFIVALPFIVIVSIIEVKKDAIRKGRLR